MVRLHQEMQALSRFEPRYNAYEGGMRSIIHNSCTVCRMNVHPDTRLNVDASLVHMSPVQWARVWAQLVTSNAWDISCRHNISGSCSQLPGQNICASSGTDGVADSSSFLPAPESLHLFFILRVIDAVVYYWNFPGGQKRLRMWVEQSSFIATSTGPVDKPHSLYCMGGCEGIPKPWTLSTSSCQVHEVTLVVFTFNQFEAFQNFFLRM